MTAELLVLELPDGREVRSDVPPPHVAQAAVRTQAALRAGRRPAHRDLVRLWTWLQEQEERYPTAAVSKIFDTGGRS
jgi:hypothetical protein